MKKNILKIIAGLAVLCTSSHMQAYRWNMRNDTDKTLLMQVELYTSVSYPTYYCIVLPKSKANNVAQYADFNWPVGNGMAGYRLERIKYLEVDPTLYAQLLKDNIIKENLETINGVGIKKPVIVNNDKTAEWLKKNNKQLNLVQWRWGDLSNAKPNEPSTPTHMMNHSSWNNLEIKEEGGKIVIRGNS